MAEVEADMAAVKMVSGAGLVPPSSVRHQTITRVTAEALAGAGAEARRKSRHTHRAGRCQEPEGQAGLRRVDKVTIAATTPHLLSLRLMDVTMG